MSELLENGVSWERWGGIDTSECDRGVCVCWGGNMTLGASFCSVYP